MTKDVRWTVHDSRENLNGERGLGEYEKRRRGEREKREVPDT
jgi:hypothetical protein